MVREPAGQEVVSISSASRLMRVLLVACLASFLAGCDLLPTQPGEGALFEGMTAVETDDPEVPFLAVHEDGEMLAVLADASSGEVVGGMFAADELPAPVQVLFRSDGSPERLVMGDEVVLFNNVRVDAVDLVYVSPDGDLQVVRDVAFDENLAREVQALAEAYKRTGGFIEGLRAARLGVSIATCSVGTAMAVGGMVVTGPLGVLLGTATLGGCTSALFTVIQLYHQRHGTDNAVINGTAQAFGSASEYLNLLTCAEGDIGGCIESGLFVVDVAARNADDAAAALASAIEQARALLSAQGGDVQVSLIWNTTADIDLWVTDPSGERIYYANRTSASGGMLDVDDRDGMGPENVFWPPGGAPAGTYVVQVDHWSGASPTGYTVTTVVQGVVRTFTGSVASGETDQVTTFTVGGGQPVAPPVQDAPTLASKPG